MSKGAVKNILTILLLSITVFSMVRYLSELKARCRLQDSLTKAQDEVAVLVKEKQNLLQELGKEKELKERLALKNSGLLNYLKASKNKIARLFQDKARIQGNLDNTSAKFSILKAENKVLIDQHKRIYAENEQFKAKLSSVVELKKAIRELRAAKRKVRASLTEGNHGFLIRNGQPVIQEKIKIEVVPAQTKE
ncbi:MAG: hypothetical protein PHC37_06095 [Candidatus Omnitrophica bacterium]|nr:hypothetical protein [Candidatus Omnitrophota bacterium]MDD5691245.1 hypothetical protein [Candidatus Omnitrophota bacterium]